MSEQERNALLKSRASALRDVAYLASCALAQEAPSSERLWAMDADLVMREARRHSMDAICALSLERAGVQDDDTLRSIVMATRRAVLFDREWQLLRERLDDAGIWYVPLKGMVLRDLYPQMEMRQMSDIDVLYDVTRGEDVRSIMVDMGYDVERFGWSAHDIYKREPIFNVEMHRMLAATELGRGPEHYLADFVPGGRLQRDDAPGCGYHMSDEDFYLYVQIHACNHFVKGGTGLRSFMDVYVLLMHSDLDWDSLTPALKRIGIYDFDCRARALAEHLFGGSELTPDDEVLLLDIASSGTYGTIGHNVSNGIAQSGGGVRGKAKYVVRRLFSTPESIRVYHPFFYKHKVLYPVLPVYRLIHRAVRYPGHTLSELRHLLKG